MRDPWRLQGIDHEMSNASDATASACGSPTGASESEKGAGPVGHDSGSDAEITHRAGGLPRITEWLQERLTLAPIDRVDNTSPALFEAGVNSLTLEEHDVRDGFNPIAQLPEPQLLAERSGSSALHRHP